MDGVSSIPEVGALQQAQQQVAVQATLTRRVLDLQGSQTLQLIQSAPSAGPAVIMEGRPAPAPPPPPQGQRVDVTV
jgi:hypothetical protein